LENLKEFLYERTEMIRRETDITKSPKEKETDDDSEPSDDEKN